MLTSSWDGAAALWDPTEPTRPVARYGTASNFVHSADLSRDGNYVVTVDFPGSAARVWEAATGRLVARSATMGDEMTFPRFVTADSGRVAVLVAERDVWEVVFWDWRGTGALTRTDWEAREFSELTVSE